MHVFVAILAAIVAVPWLILTLGPIFIVATLPLMGLTIMVGERLAGKMGLSPKRTRVLVVDDEIASVLPLISVLENSETDVRYVASGRDMIRELANRQYDLVFLDSKMPDMSGESTLAEGDQVLSLGQRLPVIFYSGSVPHVEVPAGLKQFDVQGIWSKFDLATLESSVASVVNNKERAYIQH